MDIINIILHFDQYLSAWSQLLGPWIYVIVFLIVFAETGLVVTPLLPGDSLLFALGALTTLEQGALDISILSVSLVIAALCGDNLNYFIGRKLGARLFTNSKSRFFNPQHLVNTQNFFAKWGPLAVVLARFAPIFRTFAPFVAGIGCMQYKKFLLFSFAGAVAWTQIFLWAGNLFGNLPAVKRNFHIVILAVCILSVTPMFVAWLKARKAAKVSNSASS